MKQLYKILRLLLSPRALFYYVLFIFGCFALSQMAARCADLTYSGDLRIVMSLDSKCVRKSIEDAARFLESL